MILRTALLRKPIFFAHYGMFWQEGQLGKDRHWPYHVALRYQPAILQMVQHLRATTNNALVYCHPLYTLPYAVDTGLPVLWDQHDEVQYFCYTEHRLST